MRDEPDVGDRGGGPDVATRGGYLICGERRKMRLICKPLADSLHYPYDG